MRLFIGASLLLASWANPAWAARPPETQPYDIAQDIQRSWDRSTPPGDLVLLPPRTILAYEKAQTQPYGQLFVTCQSSSDASHGRCPVTDTAVQQPGMTSPIPLRFVDQRGGPSAELVINGELYRIDPTAQCQLDYWNDSPQPLWSSIPPPCDTVLPAGTGIAMRIPAQELRKLVAGRWTGELRLDVNSPPDQRIAGIRFAFDFTITDHSAVAIYLPGFHQATPSVGLDLRYEPGSGMLGGRRVVEMCLYDGLGSQSSSLGLTVRDTSAHAPGPTGFSVWHDGGGTDARQRLDYTLALRHAGTTIALTNGAEQQLRDIATTPVQSVLLPGMTHPVLCVPTPLTFSTPPVPVTSKDAGHYTGQLQLELRVPTSTP